MKRDWKIIRRLLQLVEAAPKGDLSFCREYSYLFYEHSRLIGEGGLATVSQFDPADLHFVRIEELTDKGRSVLELSRDETAWTKAMALADEHGGLSYEILLLVLAKGTPQSERAASLMASIRGFVDEVQE